VLVVAWSILGGLWLVTAPGVLVAFGAVGDPPAGFRAGRVAALPVGYLVGRIGVRLARRGT
jgi:hypothetical protein